MKKRNLLKNNKWNSIKLISIIISFIVLVLWVYIWWKYLNDNWFIDIDPIIEKQTDLITDRVFIWDEIILQWNLTWDAQIWAFTFLFIDNELNEYWVKSRNLSLSNFVSSELIIRWTVKNFVRWLPIVEVVEVEKIKKSFEDISDDEINDLDEEIVQTKFYFWEDWFYLDFESNTWFTAILENSQIVIYETSKNASWDLVKDFVISISPFLCQAGSSTQDCSIIKNVLTANNFVTRNSITFYNISETTQWMFFNENIWWYYVSISSEEALVDVSRYIHLYWTRDVEWAIRNNIWNICFDNWLFIKNINEIIIDNDWWITNARITWTDDNLNIIYCSISINVWETISTQLLEIVKLNNNNTSNLDNDLWWIAWNSPIIEINTSEVQRFESNRGFSVNLPKDVVFQAKLVSPNETFWVAWITCDYKVVVTPRQLQDELDVNPAIKIFLCNTKLDPNDISSLISWRNLLYTKWILTDKDFIIEYLDWYIDIASSILIE